ncbi:MAG: SDR family oxidoreductase [Pseudomonadota bacterium]
MARAAFLTGATGFIGAVLARELIERGWEVTAIHRPGASLQYLRGLPLRLVAGDVTDAASLAAALPERVDAVFHVAGDTGLWSRHNERQYRVNVEGTRNMVAAALARGAKRFVHTSTISVYGLQTGRIDERAPQLGRDSPVNYQRTKFLAEEEVRAGIAKGLDAVILNPAAVMGPYDTRNWARVIRLVCEGKLPGVPPGAFSFCHVSAVASAHVAAAEHGRRGENYLLGGADATLAELVRTIGEVTGKKVPQRVTPAWVLRLLGRANEWLSLLTGREPSLTPEAARVAARRLFCDSSKAERELGYRPVPLRTMVEDSFRWLQAEGLV